MPNPGILVGVKKTALNEILSIGELESGDFKKIAEIVSDEQSLEINLSCPNIEHDSKLSWDDTKLLTNSSKREFCIVKVSPLTTIDELKFLLIVSDASLEVADDDGQSSISIEVKPSDKEKCDRCWHHTGNLKNILDSNLCSRCIENVEGEGEKRKFF